MGLQVRCICGKQTAIQIGSIGRPFTCGACRGRAVAVWGIDPRSKKAAPIALEASPGTPRGYKIPPGMSELPCPCGVRLFARPRQAGKRVQCPVCATWLKLEHSRDPQTLETRIRVVKSRLNQLPAVPPPPPRPKVEANVEFILCSCGESIRVEATSAGNQAQCPACGALIRIEMTQNSETSCFVVDPGVADPSRHAEKRGIDEELSLEDFG